MKNRNLVTVVLLSIVTFGIYEIVWFVKTKGELTRQGGDIPTSWLFFVPIASIYWLYKYCMAAEEVTANLKGIVVFASFMAINVLFVVMVNVLSTLSNASNSGESSATADSRSFIFNFIIFLLFLAIIVYTQAQYNKSSK